MSGDNFGGHVTSAGFVGEGTPFDAAGFAAYAGGSAGRCGSLSGVGVAGSAAIGGTDLKGSVGESAQSFGAIGGIRCLGLGLDLTVRGMYGKERAILRFVVMIVTVAITDAIIAIVTAATVGIHYHGIVPLSIPHRCRIHRNIAAIVIHNPRTLLPQIFVRSFLLALGAYIPDHFKSTQQLLLVQLHHRMTDATALFVACGWKGIGVFDSDFGGDDIAVLLLLLVLDCRCEGGGVDDGSCGCAGVAAIAIAVARLRMVVIVSFFVQIDELGDANWARGHGFDGSGGVASTAVVVSCRLVVPGGVVAIDTTVAYATTIANGQTGERIVELSGIGGIDNPADPGKNMFYEGGIVVNFFFHGR